MDLQSLSVLRKYIKVVDHKAGTIKLKVALSALSDPTVKQIMAQFKNNELPKAILGTQINIFTQTLTLKYNTSIIDQKEFEEILTTQDNDKFLSLAEKYHSILTA